MLFFSAEDNEMGIGWNKFGVMIFRLTGEGTPLESHDASLVDERLSGWHQHCFTWKANGKFRVIYITIQ